MARDREDYTDEPPRRRDDDYGDEPPRRRRDDDYDDYGDYGVRRRPRTGLDSMFADNFALMVVLAVCCNGIAFILGIIGLVTCKDPEAKRNAMIVTIIAGVITALGIIGNIALNLAMRR